MNNGFTQKALEFAAWEAIRVMFMVSLFVAGCFLLMLSLGGSL